MNTITTAQAAGFLQAHDNYLILTHVRPDGDTIGCAAGLCRALRQIGKIAHILENPEATELFTPYLEGLTAPAGYRPETVVSVDIAARSLFLEGAKQYLDRVDLAIDHHPSQEFFAARTCLDSGAAACGQIVFQIVSQFTALTPEIGEALYVAVSTDCGCFQYSNTDAAIHRTAELRDGGTTALVFLTTAMIDQVGASERDMDDISAFVGQIEGVKNGATLKETRDGHVKISLRTDPGDLNASSVCALLGGGGHAAAAGAMVEGTMETVRQAVIAAIEQVRGEG